MGYLDQRKKCKNFLLWRKAKLKTFCETGCSSSYLCRVYIVEFLSRDTGTSLRYYISLYQENKWFLRLHKSHNYYFNSSYIDRFRAHSFFSPVGLGLKPIACAFGYTLSSLCSRMLHFDNIFAKLLTANDSLPNDTVALNRLGGSLEREH